MDPSSEIIRATATKIVESVPYPLGISLNREVLFLNESTKNLIGEQELSKLPRDVGENSSSLYIRVDGKTLHVQIVPLGGHYSLLVSEEFVDERLMKDELTGLLSRQYLNAIGQRILSQGEQSKKIAILFMDLDGFKEINDSFGHDVGDEALKEVARRLLHSLRQTDLCFRWGGDEFIVISPGFAEKIHAGLLARRIIKILSEPFVAKGHQLKVGVSIGIAVYPDDGDNIHGLLKKADTAMYVAKEQGGNMYNFSGMG